MEKIPEVTPLRSPEITPHAPQQPLPQPAPGFPEPTIPEIKPTPDRPEVTPKKDPEPALP